MSNTDVCILKQHLFFMDENIDFINVNTEVDFYLQILNAPSAIGSFSKGVASAAG